MYNIVLSGPILLATQSGLQCTIDVSIDRQKSKKKPEKCSQCGSWRVARILYGEPANRSVERDLQKNFGNVRAEIA
jgi:NAD-dependent SIR2 family protein deacetylase